MIKVEATKVENSANGNNVAMQVTVENENMRDTLHQYAFLTAKLRDMMIENSNGAISEQNVNESMFAAFRIGMESIEHSKKAAAILEHMNNGNS